MNRELTKSQIALAVSVALSAATISAASADGFGSRKPEGTYMTGDFHNHTTCSDGSTSMQKLVSKSTNDKDVPWGLDWFVQAGHGGSGARNCTLAEDESLATPAYPLVYSQDGSTVQGPTTTWQNSNPPVQPHGAVRGTPPSQAMWRWQSVQQYQYPQLEYLSALKTLPLFMGVESVVAGHEHTSMSVITGQMPSSIFKQRLPKGPGYAPLGDATALAKWTYCFDRGDTDTSRGNTTVDSGVGNNWDCTVPGSANSTDPSLGWNDAAKKLLPAGGPGSGERGHLKTVEAMKWMAKYHPEGSYYVPAHLERAGPFNPDGNNGFNIEHLRNFNNAAPTVAFGFETQPGHGASDNRGEYRPARNNIGGVRVDSVGGTTYGGTGVYGAQVGGVWDALLGEGRNFWFFASSDWHNRGSFGPDDRRTTQDFYPGEYQRDYVMVRNESGKGRHWEDRHRKGKGKRDVLTPQAIVDGLRSGNSWTDSGQLIDRLSFVACVSNAHTKYGEAIENKLVEAAAFLAAAKNTDVDVDNKCATMGEKLEVRPGQDVIVSIVVRDPKGESHSPYTFLNPSLAQIGIEQPLNKPVLDHVDVIGGKVTGYKTPGAPDYAGQWPNDWLVNPDMNNVPDAAKNTSASVLKTYNKATWNSVRHEPEYKAMTFRLRNLDASQYVRLRGTNLPPSVPYETDADGNPLPDLYTNAGDPTKLTIPCTTTPSFTIPAGETYTGEQIDGCPEHMERYPAVTGPKYVSYDVAAWADVWFYSNPIFIEVKGGTLVAGVK